MKRNSKKWKKNTIAGLIALAVFTGLVFLVGAIVSSSKRSVASTPPKVQQDLFVDPAKVPANYCTSILQKYHAASVTASATPAVSTVVFDAGVTHDVGAGGKITSDAVNLPLNPQTLEAERAVICKDPAQAAMVMNRLGAVSIGGKTIGQVNAAWIQAQGDTDVIKTWSQGCLTNVVATHLACAKTMSYTAALLGKFQGSGVQVASTTWNVYLPNGAVVGSIPDYGLNPVQETNAYFLVFEYTLKTGTPAGVCLKFGFNVGKTAPDGGDDRIAGLTCLKPAPSDSPSGSNTPKPGCTGSGCNSGSPSCSSGCTSSSCGTCTTSHTTTPPPSTSSSCPTCVTKATASQSASPAPKPTYSYVPTQAPGTTAAGTKPTNSAPGTQAPGPTDASNGSDHNTAPIPTDSSNEAPALH